MDKQAIQVILQHVKDERQGNRDVVSLGRIASIVVRARGVGFVVNAQTRDPVYEESLRARCASAVADALGVEVTAVLTEQREMPRGAPSSAKPKTAPRYQVPGISRIIPVAAGKGGVGKSSMAAALAVMAAQKGLRVGLLDADIYGPSIPHLMGLQGKPAIEKNQFVPIYSQGVACMSMGMLFDPAQPAIWRGPMTSKTLYQLLMGTAWGELDLLLVDCPPGTGDIMLSLMEQYPLHHAIMVATLSRLAQQDVIKAMRMFERMQVPVGALIYNMSYYEEAGHRVYPFGESRIPEAQLPASLLTVDVPLDSGFGASLDAGKMQVTPAIEKALLPLIDGCLSIGCK